MPVALSSFRESQSLWLRSIYAGCLVPAGAPGHHTGVGLPSATTCHTCPPLTDSFACCSSLPGLHFRGRKSTNGFSSSDYKMFIWSRQQYSETENFFFFADCEGAACTKSPTRGEHIALLEGKESFEDSLHGQNSVYNWGESAIIFIWTFVINWVYQGIYFIS